MSRQTSWLDSEGLTFNGSFFAIKCLVRPSSNFNESTARPACSAGLSLHRSDLEAYCLRQASRSSLHGLSLRGLDNWANQPLILRGWSGPPNYLVQAPQRGQSFRAFEMAINASPARHWLARHLSAWTGVYEGGSTPLQTPRKVQMIWPSKY